jgi:hypothetical protein
VAGGCGTRDIETDRLIIGLPLADVILATKRV